MKKIQVIVFFITFANDITLAISIHVVSLFETFMLGRIARGLVSRHNINAFT